jgi:hypothetical protein
VNDHLNSNSTVTCGEGDLRDSGRSGNSLLALGATRCGDLCLEGLVGLGLHMDNDVARLYR